VLSVALLIVYAYTNKLWRFKMKKTVCQKCGKRTVVVESHVGCIDDDMIEIEMKCEECGEWFCVQTYIARRKFKGD